MGINEPIAGSEEEYVATCVRLAMNREERASIEKKIDERSRDIFLCRDAASDVQSILIALARGESTW
jgi:predicted O-linked N-acetylglucosamine transferase (SPINDLY family)